MKLALLPSFFSCVGDHCLRRAFTSLLAMTLTLSLGSCQSVRTSELDLYAGPRPIAVLLARSVWDPPRTLPTPQVAVYEDGQVILTSWEKNGTYFTPQYHTFTLSHGALNALRQQVHDLAILKPQRASYEALDDGHVVYDVAYDDMYVRDEGREAAVSVYALSYVLHSHESPHSLRLRSYERGGPPPQFMSLYYRLEALADTSISATRLWSPRHVEVRLRDDFHHPLHDRPETWPADWLTLSSKHVRQRDDHTWAFLVDGSELTRVRHVLATESDEAAVSIEGKTWAAVWRPILPGETTWWAAIRDPYRYRQRTLVSLSGDL